MKDLPMSDPIPELKKMFETRKFDDAIHLCQKLLVKNSDDPIALQNLSTAYYMVGAYEDAKKCCDRILEKEPQDEHAIKNKMLVLEKLELHEEVLECCEMILSKNENDLVAIITKGIALNKIGKHEDSLILYENALKLDKKNVDALMNMAVTLSHLKRYQEAIPYYDLVQEIMPEFSRAAKEKSNAFHELGKDDDAFLAAQGILLKDADLLKAEANEKKYSVQHAFALKSYYKKQQE